MTVTIEKGVPISEHYWSMWLKYNHPKSGRTPLYPFKIMEIGDSFLIPTKTKNVHSFRLVSNMWSARLSKRFVVLRDNKHKWRCYRINDDGTLP